MLGRAVLLSLLLATPAAAAAQTGADPVVAEAVAAMRTATAQYHSDQARYRGIRAEGRVLVIEIELMATMPDFIGPTQVLSAIAGGWCSDAQAAAFFGGGRTMRADVVREGRAIGSATIDHCPGPIGQGLSTATFAGTMQSIVGMDIDGVRVIALRAEGNSLVVILDVLAGPSGSGAEAAANFIGGFCHRPDAQTMFFANGFTMRIDTTVRGREPVSGAPITSCPGR